MYAELSPLTWVPYSENQQSNYNYFTFDKIAHAPRKWLCSLPMFEYAYVLTMITAMRMGGEPTRYIEDLYNKRLNPVVAEYYKHLMKFRFVDGLYKRRYESMQKLITGKYFVDAQCEIKKQTRNARKKMREICAKYEAEIKSQNCLP